MTMAPVLFVSHGAPTFALEPGRLGPNLAALGGQLEGIAAVLVVSPHWQTLGIHVAAAPAPQTIHDFGGFPSALYALEYPAPGSPSLATHAARLLTGAGYEVALDERRGLDHGAWVPLRHLFPGAQMPVFQVSMPHDLDAAGARRLGAALAPLRQQSVLIVGSGSLTHNLYDFRLGAGGEAPYARDFAGWVCERVLARDVDALVGYRQRAPHAERAHPSEEHYLPLLVALGASDEADTAQLIEGGLTYGMLSMDSFAWGAPAAAPAPPPAALTGHDARRP